MAEKKGKRGRKKKGARGRKMGKGSRKLNKDLRDAGSIARKNLPLTPLPRLDTGRSNETQNLLNLFSAYADPTKGSYAGARSSQMQDAVGRSIAGLDGYTAQENQGMREQMARDTNQNFMTGRAQLMRGQANARTGSTQRAAQLLELTKSYGNTRANLEQDLFVKNADEKQRRLDAYRNFLGGLEQQEYGRGREARTDLGNLSNSTWERELGTSKFNIEQEGRDRASQVSGILGTLGILDARRNARKQNQLMREQMQSNERVASRSGSGGGGGGGYYEDIINFINSNGQIPSGAAGTGV